MGDTPKAEICHNVTGYRGGGMELSCSFYDIVSDGKKYVWAAVSRGVSKIDVFDIDSGAVVGSFETCMTPRDIEYHPLRDEIWVRCMATADEFGGYMDVFPAGSPGSDTVASIDLTGNHTLSAYGYSVIDNSLGDVGYATVWNQPTLYKIDLSERVVLSEHALPNAYGGYEVAYSRKNGHIYVRASVCCTCGFEGSDLGEDCGRYGSSNVTITTGPSAGQIMNGQCGRCDGLEGVDTIGVYEFDTSTDSIIANHAMPNGAGGDPFGSPDGRHIVLVGRNGGEVLRILAAGEPGEKSTVAFDLALGFSTVDEEDSAVYNDFAFIQTDSSTGQPERDIIVIASGTENKVAIIDIANGNNVTIVDLPTQSGYPSNGYSTAKRNRRQVEHAKGTPYVWIDGTEELEMYVLNVDDATIVTTITGLATTKMISVENYAAKRTADLIAEQIMGSVSDIQAKIDEQIMESVSDMQEKIDEQIMESVSDMQAKIDNMEKQMIQSTGNSQTSTSTSSTMISGANTVVNNYFYHDDADSVDQKMLGSK